MACARSTSQLCPERAGTAVAGREMGGEGRDRRAVQRRTKPEWAKAERSGAAGDRRSGPLLQL